MQVGTLRYCMLVVRWARSSISPSISLKAFAEERTCRAWSRRRSSAALTEGGCRPRNLAIDCRFCARAPAYPRWASGAETFRDDIPDAIVNFSTPAISPGNPCGRDRRWDPQSTRLKSAMRPVLRRLHKESGAGLSHLCSGFTLAQVD